MSEIRQIFESDYCGIDTFLTQILSPIFGDYEKGYDVLTADKDVKEKANQANILEIKHAASFDFYGSELKVFDITVGDEKKLENNRVGIQSIVRQYIAQFEGALIVFHHQHVENQEWRFSYVEKRTNAKDSTSAKRYTYILGKNHPAKTITENFKKLEQDKDTLTITDLTTAFSVAPLSDDFFNEYREYYADLVQYITGKRYVKGKNNKFEEKIIDKPIPEFTTVFESKDKLARDYVKKMMGRLVFLHFLQKKGWLGVAQKDSWGNGDKNFIFNLFDRATEEIKNDFLEKALEPLFFKTLNTDRGEEAIAPKSICDIYGSKIRIPYLNGGLFEEDELDKKKVKFKKEHFKALLEFFNQYNFTIDETDPDDQEIGVDPEMLGKIFENLLEDNKDKGAFYTPKEIVQYMCRESLIAYLDEKTKLDTRNFVINHEITFTDAEKADLLKALLDVKICDPAVGSGAFPMGMLNELLACTQLLTGYSKTRSDLKKHIVKNNIYGVDIENGAVDIARLRFWLAIIVDEETPIPLPNLDYKIMQGNSLLESYEGIDLSTLTKREGGLFSDDEEVESLTKAIQGYYIPNDHIAKQKIKNVIQEKVIALLKARCLAKDTDFYSRLNKLDLHANSEFFLWHTWFGDVFNRPNDCNGFDIVIGNPPYGAKLSEQDKKTFKTLYSDVHMRTPETFCYFTSLAFKLTRNSGITSYIVPNNLFFQNENQKTRELLIFNNTLLRAINLGDNTFENADVPTCIFISRKQTSKETYNIMYSDYRNDKIQTINWYSAVQNTQSEKLKKIPGFVLGIPLEGISLLEKIKASGELLDPLLEEMACGISTGGNKIFCIDKEKATSANLEKKALFKVLNGYEMDKYTIKSDNKFIIYTTRDFDIKSFPHIENYLIPFKAKLEKRSECKTGILPWYAMNRSRYEKLFTEPKIIFRQTADSIRCTFDDDGWFVIDSVLVLKLKSKHYDYKYITGVLNSKVSNYLYQNFTQEEGRGFAQVKPINIRKLYIPKASMDEQKEIIQIVDRILELKKTSSEIDTTELESKIDTLVYKLYGLTAEEIQIIER